MTQPPTETVCCYLHTGHEQLNNYLSSFNNCGRCSQNASFILTCNTDNVLHFLAALEHSDWTISVDFSPDSQVEPDVESAVLHVSLSVYKIQILLCSTMMITISKLLSALKIDTCDIASCCNKAASTVTNRPPAPRPGFQYHPGVTLMHPAALFTNPYYLPQFKITSTVFINMLHIYHVNAACRITKWTFYYSTKHRRV